MLYAKLRTIRRDPLHSVTRRVRFLVERTRARAWLKGCGMVQEFLARRPAAALPPDAADLWFLYRTVRARRPRHIVEFGSGCSTVAMALALRDNARAAGPSGAAIHSVDADPYWAAQTEHAIPTPLRAFCRIIRSPLLPVTHAGTPAFRHRDLPSLAPDLVYLDGPALTPERRVAVDVLDLEDRFPPGFFLVVDGRWTNAMFLRQHLRRAYRFSYGALSQRATFELVSGHGG